MKQPESTCWTLVLAAAAGQPEETEEFCRRYGPVIKSYLRARWRLPEADSRIEDVSQEILLQCIKPGGALQGLDEQKRSGFHSYLFAVTSNVAKMWERTQSRRKEENAPMDVLERHGTESELSKEFDRAWALLVIREARDLMRQRTGTGREAARLRLKIMEMRYVEGAAPREIATRLNQDAQRVYSELDKGRGEFRACLVEVMCAYHPEDTEAAVLSRCGELLTLLTASED